MSSPETELYAQRRRQLDERHLNARILLLDSIDAILDHSHEEYTPVERAHIAHALGQAYSLLGHTA